MTRIVDFDKFRAEQKDEPVLLVIGGEQYALPSSLPASMAVDMMRMQELFEDEDSDVPSDAMDAFGRSLFGETMWEAILRRHRVTITELPVLMEMVFNAYGSEAPKEEPGETPASTSGTEEPASTSSRRGRGSKRTSSGSTGST